VNGLCLVPGGFAHALGSPAGGGRQQDFFIQPDKNLQYGIDNRCLPRSRSAGEHHDRMGKGIGDGFDLFFRQTDIEPGLHPFHSLFRIHRGKWRRHAGQFA